eukprot:9729611-Lingulodinium_polyedra.AAC.1
MHVKLRMARATALATMPDLKNCLQNVLSSSLLWSRVQSGRGHEFSWTGKWRFAGGSQDGQ